VSPACQWPSRHAPHPDWLPGAALLSRHAIKAPRVLTPLPVSDRPRSERASVRSRHAAAVRSTAPQPAPPSPMPRAGHSTSPSRHPPPQRVPQGRRRRRRADECPARRPAGQGRRLPRGGIRHPRRPVRGARAESGCHLGSRASRALARHLTAPPTPPSPSRVRRSAKPIQAASTPVRARCAAASVPPCPHPVPPTISYRASAPVSASTPHPRATAKVERLSAVTKLPPPCKRVCAVGAEFALPVPLLPCLPSPCRVQGVRGNARTTSCINRAHQ
jgi:hypothetical protein